MSTDRLRELLRMMQQGGLGGEEGSDSSSSEEGSARSRSSSNSSTGSDYASRPKADTSFKALKEQLDIFLAEPERPFRPGDIVKWKPGCSNRKRPKQDEYAVVIEVLPEPLYSQEKSSGTPYFHEPLDIVLGMLDSDGDLVRYVYDKRRFCIAMKSEDVGSLSPSGKLHQFGVDFSQPCTLRVGDVVMLKKGLRHRRIPDYSTIAVVVEVFPEPFRDTSAEEGTSSFYELISGRIAYLDRDGDLACLCVDLRRFRKVK